MRMIRAVVCLSLAAVLALSGAPAAAQAQRNVAGKAVKVIGQVYTSANRGQSDKPLAPNGAVFEGDWIITGPSSRAELHLADTSIMVIGPGSQIKIRALTINKAAGERRGLFDVFVGSFRASVSKIFASKKSVFELDMATAVAGVRGTVLSGSVLRMVDSKGRQFPVATVRVESGIVEMRGKAVNGQNSTLQGAVSVTGGKKASATTEGGLDAIKHAQATGQQLKIAGGSAAAAAGLAAMGFGAGGGVGAGAAGGGAGAGAAKGAGIAGVAGVSGLGEFGGAVAAPANEQGAVNQGLQFSGTVKAGDQFVAPTAPGGAGGAGGAGGTAGLGGLSDGTTTTAETSGVSEETASTELNKAPETEANVDSVTDDTTTQNNQLGDDALLDDKVTGTTGDDIEDSTPGQGDLKKDTTNTLAKDSTPPTTDTVNSPTGEETANEAANTATP